MKKIISILVTSIVMLSLVGCGDSPTPEKEGSNIVKEAENKKFKVGDTVELKDFKITVNSVSANAGGEYIKPKEGKEFFKVDITVENISKEQQTMSSMMMFKVVDKDGRSYSQAFTENQNGSLDGSVGSGRKISGEYVVEIPAGATGLELEFDSSLLTGEQVIVQLN